MDNGIRIGRALRWIIDILRKHRIPHQITGGLAAQAHGSNRELADIDISIPEESFPLLLNDVRPFITFGPAQYRDTWWDLMLLTLCYEGQVIDLGGAYKAKIFDQRSREWVPQIARLDLSESKEMYGVVVPVETKSSLVGYKQQLRRPCDLEDITYIDRSA